MGSPRPSSSGDDHDMDVVGDKDNSKSTEYNIFRDSLLRYCGYANEVGESFRYQFPRWVGPTYGIAFGYCLADAVSSGYTAYHQQQQQHHQQQQNDITFPRTTTATAAMWTSAFDTLLWQSLASVAIPGAVIHAVVRAARWAVPRCSPVAALVPVVVAHWLPTAVGLGAIPLIVHPIDGGVDYVLDHTTRKYLYKTTTM